MSHIASERTDNPSVQPAEDSKGLKSPPDTLPSCCIEGISRIPKLSREQCGHLRHFHNLASQLDGDWSLMQGASGQQYDDSSYRYQLSHMAYAAGAAHYHRLPALRSVFRSLLQKLISKMLHKDVWGYWYLTSQSGRTCDPDIEELRKPWADPVCKENVMYSGHVLLMVSLYSMLFAEDRYDKQGSIVFDWDPMWFGMGPEKFSYTRMKLQETILKQMEASGWIGACCEPNMVFIICNQFPILATRYNDVWNNTNIVEDVLKKYKAAWAKQGFIAENGLFRGFYSVKQDRLTNGQDISHSAWVMAYMAWNHDQIKSMYPTIGTGYLQHIGDRINLRPPPLANAIRKISSTENLDPESPSVLERARKEAESVPASTKRYMLPTFGFVAQWLSEIAGSPDLDALLRHADQFLNPTWSKGGLYYARNDDKWDKDENYLHMDQYSGNGAIGYARLNVKYGQKKMWDKPWAPEEVKKRPCIEGVDLAMGVDFVRGVWIEERQVMLATMRSWDGEEVELSPVVKMLPVGRWGVYIDKKLKKEVDVKEKGEDVGFDVKVGGDDLDIALIQL